jgi:hypothetical protein
MQVVDTETRMHLARDGGRRGQDLDRHHSCQLWLLGVPDWRGPPWPWLARAQPRIAVTNDSPAGGCLALAAYRSYTVSYLASQC